MAIYRRKDSKHWWYSFAINGCRFRGSTKTPDRETAKLIEAKIRADAVLGEHTGKREVHTLDEAFGRYWLEHAHRLPSAGDTDYQSRTLLSRLGRGHALDRLADNDIALYVARRRGEVSDASVNRELGLLRRVLRMADHRWGWAVSRPNWKAHWLIEPEPRRRYLTADEAQRLLDATAPHLRPAIELSLLTGVRLSNCITLDWSQIDMRGREIVFRLKSRKPGGKTLILPMSAPLFLLLANMGTKNEGRVFTYKGRPVKTWKTAWKAALRRAGISDFRWHDLRHTAASWMVQSGVELDVVRKVLGHDSIETTMRYAHRESSAERAAMEAVGSRFSHVLESGEGQAVEMKRKRA